MKKVLLIALMIFLIPVSVFADEDKFALTYGDGENLILVDSSFVEKFPRLREMAKDIKVREDHYKRLYLPYDIWQQMSPQYVSNIKNILSFMKIEPNKRFEAMINSRCFENREGENIYELVHFLELHDLAREMDIVYYCKLHHRTIMRIINYELPRILRKPLEDSNPEKIEQSINKFIVTESDKELLYPCLKNETDRVIKNRKKQKILV